MPVLRHAIKKLRVDARRTRVNKSTRTITKKAVKSVRTDPNQKNLREAFSALDQAAKKGIIHEGKANRLKSRLNRLVVESEGEKKKKVAKSVRKAARQKTIADRKAK